MANWSVDDSAQRARYGAGKAVPVQPAAMSKYHEWRRKIQDENTHPKTAADAVGDMHYEQLGGRLKGIYTIRLSQEHRVVFNIDDVKFKVIVTQIGGHFP
jgi:Txe/YoeB family toxin of Txe-Axe toxin-antitoxin module